MISKITALAIALIASVNAQQFLNNFELYKKDREPMGNYTKFSNEPLPWDKVTVNNE